MIKPPIDFSSSVSCHYAIAMQFGLMFKVPTVDRIKLVSWPEPMEAFLAVIELECDHSRSSGTTFAGRIGDFIHGIG